MKVQKTRLDYSQFYEMMQPYRSAIQFVKGRLESIDDELRCENHYSPIHQIQSRIKTLESIEEKCERKHLPKDVMSFNKLYDIAGLRVVCHYINDIQYISQLLIMQEDIHLIKTVNYIDYPKESGYRSLHLVVLVPVYLKNGKKNVPVEIQMRTIAMDFWASLEHDILYKTKRVVSDEIRQELKQCANQMAQTDLKMQRIYQKVYQKDI